jgi:hypothetical protein
MSQFFDVFSILYLIIGICLFNVLFVEHKIKTCTRYIPTRKMNRLYKFIKINEGIGGFLILFVVFNWLLTFVK